MKSIITLIFVIAFFLLPTLVFGQKHYQWEFQDPESGYIEKIDLYKRMDEPSFVRVTQGILGLKKKRLAEYFQDCPELIYKIENGEFKDPVEIANFYNHNKEYV